MKFQAYLSDLFQEPVLRTKYVWCKVTGICIRTEWHELQYQSFVLLIRYLLSLFMVHKDLSNPTIKT